VDTFWKFHQAARRSALHRRGDQGVTLIEVLVAFVVLIVALIPLSYLFTTSLIQAGQATNQQTALSIAEKWTEVLSNTTPPVNPSTGAVITDVASAPQGPAPTSAATTVASGSNNQNLATASTIDVASVANFAPASTTTPQYAQVTTGSGA
jgi:Tfp pilus assembly protein PilV